MFSGNEFHAEGAGTQKHSLNH